MDPASKNSLKMVGVIAIIALVGAFGYSSMRKNSLEQTGRVIEQSQLPYTIPCGGGSNISSINVTDGECTGVTCSDGSLGDLPPGATGGDITSLEASGCGAQYQGNSVIGSYSGSSDAMSCLVGACIGIVENNTGFNQTGKDDTNTTSSPTIKPRTQR